MVLNRFFHCGIIFSLLISTMLPSSFKRLSRAVKPVVSCVALTTKLCTLQAQLKNDQNHNIQATLCKDNVEFFEEWHKFYEELYKLHNDVYEELYKLHNDVVEARIKSLPLLKDVDPKLYELFDQVRQRKGIREQIPIFSVKEDGLMAAYYQQGYVYFEGQWIKRPHIGVVNRGLGYSFAHVTACHEYEHHKQAFEYYGSYHGSNSYQKEQAADAAAAGEVNCYICLHLWKKFCYGSLAAHKGYFTSYDIQPYYEAAKANGELCNQHSKQSRLRRSFMFPETNMLMFQECQSYSGFLNM